ncbi:MAG: hypothetical protein ACLSA6_17135 [Holdemania massiliensis]
MNEQINRKKSYGLMIIAMLLYGVDLAAVYYCTQLLYKNIVEITVIVVLVPIYFIIWALRGKKAKRKIKILGWQQAYLDCRHCVCPRLVCYVISMLEGDI